MLRTFLIITAVGLHGILCSPLCDAKPMSKIHPTLSLKKCYKLDKKLPTFGNLGAVVSAAMKVTVDNPGMDPVVMSTMGMVSHALSRPSDLLSLRDVAWRLSRYIHSGPKARRHVAIKVAQYIKRCQHTNVAQRIMGEFQQNLDRYRSYKKSQKGSHSCKIVPGCRTLRDRNWGFPNYMVDRTASRKCFQGTNCSGRKDLNGFIHRRVLQGIPAREIHSLLQLAKATMLARTKRTPAQLVEAWRKAWEQSATLGHVRKLIPWYHPNFRHASGRMGRSAYMKRLGQGARKYKSWSIQVSQVKVVRRSTSVIVTRFRQRYTRPGYSDDGIKTLVWRKYKGSWKVFRERWKALPK